MRNLLVIAVAAALSAQAAPTLDNEAIRGQKGALVLQCGSDWCVSGEDVREAFESTAFTRSKIGQQYVLGIYDEMDVPTEAVKAKNELVKGILIRTRRFPAITCYANVGGDLRVFAQNENVPNSVTGEKLAKAIQKVTQRKSQAEALFKKAAAEKDPSKAADMYGQGFDILAALMGPFHFKELTTGDWGWRKEWDALCKLDAGDKYGWLAHFELDDYKTVELVEKLTNEKTEGSKSHAELMVQKYKTIPHTHFTPNQKQFVKVLEYSLTQEGTDKPLTAPQKKLMKEAFALGRDTLWGQFAMGRLILDGESIESKGLKHAAVRPRSANASGSSKSFPIDNARSQVGTIKPGAKLNDPQKLAIARYAALRLIGERGWQQLISRPGSGPFVKAFLDDRIWLEDFAWSGTFPANSSDAWCAPGSGPGDGAAAILALESLIFQDNGRWVPYNEGKYADNEGRRFMTALAIVFSDKDEAWLADVLDAYRATALAGRFHKSAYDQPVWLWRFAVHQGHGTGGCDNMAAQQRHMDKFMNLPVSEYHRTWIAYRLKNSFGDSVHGPWYYKPWEAAGEWPKRKYSQIVGGVCGELSKYSSSLINSHGMPSTTIGQPVHCAFSYRKPDGTWQIGNNVWPPSTLHMCFWNKHPWQYTPALEGTYSGDREKRLGAERMLTLATIAEESKKSEKVIETYYQHACAAKSDHYGAWNAYGAWLMGSDTPLDKIRIWVRGCARGIGRERYGRQPLWDILTPYFERVAREKGKEALKDDLVEFAPLLRQPEKRIAEESNFSTNLTTWTKPIAGDRQMNYDVLRAMLEAQYDTPEYFSQVMGWGSDLFTKSSDGSALFTKCLNEAIAAKTKNQKGGGGVGGRMDFGPMLLAASRNGNVDAFRNIVKLQAKFSPLPKANGSPYPAKDFGGDLLSKGGLLQTSSTCGHDHPANYPMAIDDSPCGEGAFHTDSEEAPWAAVKLGGPTNVKGVVIENRFGNGNNGRQVPLVVEISDDGKSWQEVFSTDVKQDTYRVDLRGSPNTVHYVRVGRKAGARKDFFHLNKILVYGTKLY